VNEDAPENRDDGTAEDLLRAAPGLARVAGEAWWRTAEWSLGAVRDHARRLLGVDEAAPAEAAPPASEEEEEETAREDDSSAAALRERGADLLRRSADVDLDDDAHPAYARILSDLAPDEGRILRLLATAGPQPAVDVRTARPLNVGSQLVAPGLNMIGREAGCRYVERVPAYLNNLYRLGLIWFSRERLDDPLRYQVLEAQPEVGEALREAGRGKTVRRTIHLTPFGRDFCEVCLPS
jgi:abortive infection alpha-like protein